MEADRIVDGTIEKLHLEKKAILNEDSTKFELQLVLSFKLKISIYDPYHGVMVRDGVFEGTLNGSKYEAALLDEYLRNPLTPSNALFKSEVFTKVLNGLRHRLRQFARRAV